MLLVFAFLQEHYPDLMKYVRVRVIELMDHVLSTYDRKIGDFTAQQFKRTGMLDVLLNCSCAQQLLAGQYGRHSSLCFHLVTQAVA